MKFIKTSAFLSWKSVIPRCQNVPESDCWHSLQDFDYVIALSHRWESAEHPDPNGEQLHEAQRRVRSILLAPTHPAAVLVSHKDKKRKKERGPLDATNVGVFYDFCSIPQKPRSPSEQEEFYRDLDQMNALFANGSVLVLTDTASCYMKRAWCFLEYLIAAVTGSLVIQDDQLQLQDETMKSIRHVLEGGDNYHMQSGSDQIASRNFFIARVLRKLVSSLDVTNKSDKSVVYRIMVQFMDDLSPTTRQQVNDSSSSDRLQNSTKYKHMYDPPPELVEEWSNNNKNEADLATNEIRVSFDLAFDLHKFIQDEVKGWKKQQRDGKTPGRKRKRKGASVPTSALIRCVAFLFVSVLVLLVSGGGLDEALKNGPWKHDLSLALCYMFSWTLRETLPRIQNQVNVKWILVKHWAGVGSNVLCDAISVVVIILSLQLNYEHSIEMPLSVAVLAAAIFTREYLQKERYKGYTKKHDLQRLLQQDKQRFGDKDGVLIVSAKHKYKEGDDTWKLVENVEPPTIPDWGIDCRLADAESRKRIGSFLSGQSPFAYHLVGDVLYGWLAKPHLSLRYSPTCPLSGVTKLGYGLRGSLGSKLLQEGATSNVTQALNTDRQGVYRVWAMEFEPPIDWLVEKLQEVVKDAKSAENQIELLESRMATLLSPEERKRTGKLTISG